jgi:hypothetical protein
MTAQQAYQILGVRPGAGWAAVTQAYTTALQAAQRQLVPGKSLAVRQKAEDQIAALKTAFEFLQNTAGPSGSAAPSREYAPPPRPSTSTFRAPPGRGGPAVPISVPAIPNPAVLAGFALAAAVVLFIALACLRATGPDHKKENKTAHLRILSVPWSYVTVDGQPLGPSGQANAFVLSPGEHKLVLCQGQTTLTKTISLPHDGETIVRVQLEKGQIDVAHKPIPLSSY